MKSKKIYSLLAGCVLTMWMVLLVCSFFYVTVYAETVEAEKVDIETTETEASENKQTESADEEEVEKIKVDNTVDIYIELEDESRFMGISLYKVGNYNPEKEQFEYDKQFESLKLISYHRISRESEASDAAKALYDFIIEQRIEPTATTFCRKGTMVAKKLPVGVYVVMQNEDDFNASISKPFLIETPEWSEEEMTYLYEIHKFPKWEREVWFSFRPEVVFPTLKVVAMILFLLLCIFGPRFIRSVFFIVSSLGFGLLGMELSKGVNSSYLAMMVFFLLFAFLGLGLVMAIASAFESTTKKLHIYEFLQRKQFWIVPVFGAAMFAFLTYIYYVKNVYIILALFVALGILGVVLQYIKKDEQIIFYTYDDLISDHSSEKKGDDTDAS